MKRLRHQARGISQSRPSDANANPCSCARWSWLSTQSRDMTNPTRSVLQAPRPAKVLHLLDWHSRQNCNSFATYSKSGVPSNVMYLLKESIVLRNRDDTTALRKQWPWKIRKYILFNTYILGVSFIRKTGNSLWHSSGLRSQRKLVRTII